MSVVSSISTSLLEKGPMPLDRLFVHRIVEEQDKVYADIHSQAGHFIRVRALTEAELAELSNQVTLRSLLEIPKQ